MIAPSASLTPLAPATRELLSPERLNVEAIYAAPFFNSRSSGPADGMEKSYEEIFRLLERLAWPSDGFVYRGSTAYLPDERTPVPSAAAEDLIAKSDGHVGRALLALVEIAHETGADAEAEFRDAVRTLRSTLESRG